MEAKSDNININSIQYGENNHIEYKWSNIQEEKILQLSFQLVRTTDREKRYRLATKEQLFVFVFVSTIILSFLN
mgnify:CR=1 FL=1